MNRDNLEKLASYLEGLPADYKHFGMQTFLSQDGDHYPYADKGPAVGTCGTVACAVGHGPAAGIPPIFKNQGWDDYSYMAFKLEIAEWTWCFAGGWSEIDDTPQGAAKRIRYLLEHGVPKNEWDQRIGIAPYIFAQETAA